jgi:uncharacterized protein (UPF0548 family)
MAFWSWLVSQRTRVSRESAARAGSICCRDLGAHDGGKAVEPIFVGSSDRAGALRAANPRRAISARQNSARKNYQFSDPRIVVAHFDPGTPLLGRLLLLEIKVWRLHYLNGVVIGDVRNDNAGGTTTFGFRYDTLEGHLECGSEWFTLRKDHASGTVRHRIEAAYREGAFPNWWSRVGFKLFAERLQRLWHYRAQERLYLLAHHGVFGDLSCGGSLTACRSAARGDAHARPCVRTRGSSRVALCAGRFRYLPPTDDRTRFTAHAISSGSSLGTAWLVLLETTSALCSDCRAHSRSTVMR